MNRKNDENPMDLGVPSYFQTNPWFPVDWPRPTSEVGFSQTNHWDADIKQRPTVSLNPKLTVRPCHVSEVGSLVSTKIWLFSGSMLILGMVSSASYEIPWNNMHRHRDNQQLTVKVKSNTLADMSIYIYCIYIYILTMGSEINKKQWAILMSSELI